MADDYGSVFPGFDNKKPINKQCIKCNVELIPSKALQNAFVGGLEGGSCRRESMNVSDFEVGDTLTRAGAPHMIDCLKCPVCGYSITASLEERITNGYNPLKRFGLDKDEPDHTDEELVKWCNEVTETTIEVKFKNSSGHHPNDIREIIENHLKNFLHGCDVSVIVKSPIIEDSICTICNQLIIKNEIDDPSCHEMHIQCIAKNNYDTTMVCCRCGKEKDISEFDATGICFKCEDFKDSMKNF